ncbi:hypothetical protein QBC47DRAFT_32254 [Echria macrotheca]|uniref:Inosine/uridine-preferring nucleoside hydrolase domain-containing protein n=1 Tax=Echria macrotheca TaxID=438768 RepID=A0AAJ0FA96_9PEZI|nr:hypothetical protein QBC47DRAFT_32254 [Echria macrotheca]
MSSVAVPGASAAPSAFDERAFRKRIPFPERSPEYGVYLSLIKVLRARKASDKPRILVITDIEQDYDDLMAIVFLSEMHRLGAVELAGFIANHGKPETRAKFLRTIVNLLGLGHLPVAEGTIGVEDQSKKVWIDDSYYELKNITFAEQPWNNEPFQKGIDLIEQLVQEVDQGKEPLTVLLISSLQDISEYFDRHKGEKSFLQSHFKKFVSQGGYEVKENADGSCVLEPIMGMANNGWHPTAARNFTNCLVEYDLPSDAWSREAAKEARLDGGTFADLAPFGPIGAHLSWLYRRQEFKFYWDPFNAPYLPRLNAEWYLKTRLVLDPKSKIFSEFKKSPPTFEKVLPLTKVIAYDGCAAMGAVGDDVMRALGIMDENLPNYNQASHRHRVFGRGERDLGGIDGAKLGETFKIFFLGALRATKANAEKLIPSSSVRHQEVKYDVSLDVFDKQIPYLRQSKELADEARQGNQESQRKLEQLKAAKLDGADREFPKVPEPEDIPYELLYQAAIHGAHY